VTLTETTAKEGEHESHVIDDRLGNGKLQGEGQQSKNATRKRGGKKIGGGEKSFHVSSHQILIPVPSIYFSSQ
jgi:hypothetical protein